MPGLPAYTDVLVATDLSSRAAVALALAHAYALVADAGTVHLVHVLELPARPSPLYAHYGPTAMTPEQRGHKVAEIRSVLESLVERHPPPPGVHVRIHVSEQFGGDVAERLCDASRELEASVVCLLSHARRGLERVLVGSVTEKVLRCCEAPVLVIRIPQDRPLVD